MVGPLGRVLHTKEMDMRSTRSIPVAAALLAALASGCGEDGLGGILISDSKEIEIGQGVDQQIEAEMKIAADDDPTSVWAREMLAPMVLASAQFRNPAEIGGYKIEVIVDDDLVNAFAAPGGFLYITTGLIAGADGCGEIAGVLGHELGHVTERHGVKQIEGQFAASAIADFFLGDGITKEAAKLIWAVLQSTQFSQRHESESDSVGLQIAHDAGYHPDSLASFFQKLLDVQAAAGGGRNAITDFLSSHPATEDRIEAVRAEAARRYPNLADETLATVDCVGTTQTLADVVAHIEAGGVQVRPGTGEGLPDEEGEDDDPPPEDN
jgi:predicted Zn-dependent protease